MKRSFIREILEAIDSDTISFAGGLPDESLFPTKSISEITQKILCDPSTLQYSISSGLPSLREKIASHYCELGLQTGVENILITTGAQQAIDLISRVYFKNGVVAEAPAYLGALNTFSANGCVIHPIKLNKDGIDFDKFYASFKHIKNAYLMSDFQNPTGNQYDTKTREKLAEAALKCDGIIVDDGAYMELYFENRLPMLPSFAPNNTLHLGSFSKILAPGLRLGWIRGDKKLLQPILALKERADLHTSTLSQKIADEFLGSSELNIHLSKIRSAYKAKCDTLAKELELNLPTFRFQKPKGGMFIYGSFEDEIDAFKLTMECLKNKAVFVPGSEFYCVNHKRNEARFNFTHSSSFDTKRGIEIISNTYQSFFR